MPTFQHRRQQAIRTNSCPSKLGIPIIILEEDCEEDGVYFSSISQKTMPYAEPTSPIPSPAKETSSRKGWMSPPTHVEDMDAGPSIATGPMPGIPRRTSSNHASSSSTPRRALSPTVSRHSSATQPFVASRPMEGLPRRLSSSGGGSGMGVSGLPTDGGSLGLKLHPSPVKGTVPPPTPRSQKDSMSSVSTVDSSLPPTPSDEPADLPYTSPKDQYISGGIPFPPYQPAPRSAAPARSAMSPARPTLINSRRSSHMSSHRRDGHSGSLQMFPQSSSSSHLPVQSTPVGTYSPAVRPASMIRKKSGEVVKPSLKQRSMSTPDLTRQKEESSPNSPETEDRDFPEERSKSVRFADTDEAADGRALENVVLFLREQKVTAIGKAADPDRAGQITDTETEVDNDTDASDFVQFRTRRNAAAQKTDDDRLVMEGGSTVPRVRVDFGDPRSLQGENVVLERIELATDAGPLHLKGTAIVRNLSFQKWVAVRFTMDHWQTVSEVAGLHVTHIPSETTGDEGWDRFSFSVKLEDYKRKLDERQLVMCIRFSIDGQEWWDSNTGINYNFTFKKAAPRRPTRHSNPAGYPKMAAQDASLASLPGLRQNRHVSPSSQINRAFGVSDSNRQTTGPKSWIFPKFAASIDGPPSRPDSPVTPAPAASFRAPKVPDVHNHLSLSKRYCAPSPPTSPPKLSEGDQLSPPLMLSPDVDLSMGFVAGHPATLYPARAGVAHERRSSWNGETDTWKSFSQALSETSETETDEPVQPIDGETTPIALRSRSPQRGGMAPDPLERGREQERDMDSDSRDGSPEFRGLRTKRSTGNLRDLLSDETPPSSNVSSPPSPAIVGLPVMDMSPHSSVASTGASSPITNFSNSDSGPDLSDLVIQVDPDERGRVGDPKLLTNNYEEFLKKFCFFQSPRMTPVEGIVPSPHPRAYAHPGQPGHGSPSGFPFFHNSSSNSPRGTPTPTGQYDSASDAFNFPVVPSPLIPHSQLQLGQSTSSTGSTEETDSTMSSMSTAGTEGEGDGDGTAEMGGGAVEGTSGSTPKATPMLGNSPGTPSSHLEELQAAYGTQGLPWARSNPPQLAGGH